MTHKDPFVLPQRGCACAYCTKERARFRKAAAFTICLVSGAAIVLYCIGMWVLA